MKRSIVKKSWRIRKYRETRDQLSRSRIDYARGSRGWVDKNRLVWKSKRTWKKGYWNGVDWRWSTIFRGIWTGPRIRGSPWQRLRLEASNNKHSGRKIRGKRNVLRNFVSLSCFVLTCSILDAGYTQLCIHIYTGIVDSSTRRRTKNCSANFVTLSPVIHDEKFTLDVASITRKRDGWRKGGGGGVEGTRRNFIRRWLVTRFGWSVRFFHKNFISNLIRPNVTVFYSRASERICLSRVA